MAKPGKANKRANKSTAQNFPKSEWMVKRELSPDCNIYNGPVRSPVDFEQQDCYTTILQTDGILVSSAGGVINPVYSNNPFSPGGGLGACAGWTSLSQVFDEFRVLAWEIEVIAAFAGAAATPGTIVVVKDYDSSAALLSYGAADNYSSQKTMVLDAYKPLNRKIVMHLSGLTADTFFGTTVPQASMWMKMYSDTLAASANYARIFIRYRVQFRGRGL